MPRRYIPVSPRMQRKFESRGEWTAQTDDDAKQMAIDFANGVS